MRIYLSGPMSGYPSFNVPLFDAAAADLRAQGYEVVSPVDEDRSDGIDTSQLSGDLEEFEEKTKRTWGDLIARDVKLIADGNFDAIVVLLGWHKSQGARLEVFLGLLKCIPILVYYPNEKPHPMSDHAVLWFIQESFK